MAKKKRQFSYDNKIVIRDGRNFRDLYNMGDKTTVMLYSTSRSRTSETVSIKKNNTAACGNLHNILKSCFYTTFERNCFCTRIQCTH